MRVKTREAETGSLTHRPEVESRGAASFTAAEEAGAATTGGRGEARHDTETASCYPAKTQKSIVPMYPLSTKKKKSISFKM